MFPLRTQGAQAEAKEIQTHAEAQKSLQTLSGLRLKPIKCHLGLTRLMFSAHMEPAAAIPPGFLNKCLELRLEWISSPQAHSAQP